MGLFEFFKKEKKAEINTIQNKMAIPSSKTTVSPKKTSKPVGIPSRKPLKQMTVSPVGLTYDCKKTDKFNRQDIMINLREGDIVVIEKYKYKGKNAYLLVDSNYHADFGVINAELANEISSDFQDCEFEAYVSKTDFFFPEKDSDEQIYTCRVKLYILPKEN